MTLFLAGMIALTRLLTHGHSTSLIVLSIIRFLIFVSLCIVSPDDDERDMQGDRAVDYGKRHEAIDIL